MKTYFKLILSTLTLYHCSGSGSSSSSPENNDKNIAQQPFSGVTGTVASPSGSQTEWAGSLVYLASTKGHGRLGVIDSQGSFKLLNLDRALTYSMYLLSRDFTIQATLSNLDGADKQMYFNLQTDTIPRATISGKDISLSSKNNVNFLPSSQITDKKDFTSFNVYHQFTQYVDFFGVQIQKSILSDDSVKRYLVFNAKVSSASDLSNIALTIVGADTLLNGAQLENPADLTLSPWLPQSALFDDGLHNDGSPNDNLWGAKVLLKTGQFPGVNQVVYLHLEGVNKKSEKVIAEYPFIFSGENFTDTTIKISANSPSVRHLQLSGSPFSTVNNFRWLASIFDGKNKVYEGDYVDQTKREIDVDLKTYTDPNKYKISVSLMGDDVFPGFPAFILKLKDSSIN